MLALLCTVSCSRETTGPDASPVRLAAVEGASQFVVAGQTAAAPLTVQATDPSNGRAVKDVEITWRLVGGQGGSVAPTTAKTDGVGVTSVSARAGPATGTYRFEATAPYLVGDPAVFELRAVDAPQISSVSPAVVRGGDVVTIDGSNFTGTVADHGILFGGLRGSILSVSAGRITARVPDCVLDRATDVRITLGAVPSNALPIETISGPVAPVVLTPGQFTTLRDAQALSCFAIEGVPAGGQFLLVTQNAARAAGVPMRYELTAVATGGTPAPREQASSGLHEDAASSFELMLRREERELGPAIQVQIPPDALRAMGGAVPGIGDRRDFNVLTQGGGTRKITATVRALSERAVIYVDDEAPANGLGAADLAYFGGLFDDPIYATDTSVFGQPSDIDGNGDIIILFTPAVNALTEAGASGFIAGYFYGCDLVSASRCSATNRGEIFYSMVPDPAGQFGSSRSRDVVLRTVPAVLAHEFQHMINFSHKSDRLDLLWLSEGLAHAAEDLVGDALADRGDPITAAEFRRPNYTRAQLYLQRTQNTPLLSEDSPGSLEQRGGAWLLVKYLAGQYGGDALLRTMTSSSAFGVANIEQSTGQAWSDIYAGFSTALWADGAPGLGGTIDPAATFRDFDLRGVIGSLGGGIYPLVPPTVSFQDFQISATLAGSGQTYLLLSVPSAMATARFGVTGRAAGPFAAGTAPQVTILRVR